MTDVVDERLHPARWAAVDPDRIALVMASTAETRTYREIDEASQRLACFFRARGLENGGHVAVMLENQPEFYDVTWAAFRCGAYITTINWHLTADEAGYIVADCEGSIFVTTAKLASVVEEMGSDLDGVTTKLVVDGDLPGFEQLDEVIAGQPLEPVPDECEGAWMFYSSGTTGRPKGIKPPLAGGPIGPKVMMTNLLTGLFNVPEDAVYLSPAPLYHAAPAGWTNGIQRTGGTAVVMEHFDPIDFLAAIEKYRVTHVQVVPTHFVRLLKLPKEDRERFDLSSLQMVVHAAAPCPVEIKRQAIEWLGPIVHEFYSGSEGAGFTYIKPHEWLEHPGSVGKSLMGDIHVLDDEGNELPVGDEGQIWFSTNRPFEYHNDPKKTASVWDSRGWATLGDVGRVDEDGYLYLTDRVSNMIISGGVNIYPQEAEDILVVHPAVHDVGVIGTPEPEMGEQVTAFVQVEPGVEANDKLAAELIAYCRDRLSHFKCPREVRFVDELPRLPTGKLLKRLLH